uniref:Uncharacterized protein n=1 Tax=Aegilops tauschii subsp. strangulata TaxID=200361 RepID=A0A453NAE9_AEGTS
MKIDGHGRRQGTSDTAQTPHSSPAACIVLGFKFFSWKFSCSYRII